MEPQTKQYVQQANIYCTLNPITLMYLIINAELSMCNNLPSCIY